MLCSSIFLTVALIAQAVSAETSTTTLNSTSTKTSLANATTKIPSATSRDEIFMLPSKSTSSTTTSSTTGPLGASVSAITGANDTISTSYTSDSDFQSSILAAHNFFREEHNATDLKWNSTSAKFAAAYAKKCTFKHSGNPTGENLAAGYPNVTTAVNVWGLEREKYNFSAPGFSETTGHFTQVVWKATKSVGCGRYACDGNNGTSGYYIVCEYYPLGNVQGQYSTEVGEEVTGNSSLGYGMGGISSTTGYGWLIGIVVGVCANIVFVVMLVWKLS